MPKTFSQLTEDIFEILSEADKVAARELHLYADNHADLHRQRTTPIHKNLRNKMAAGKYDHEKAKKLFKYAADDAAKRYKADHGHHFDVATRKHVASKMADQFRDEARDGHHDHHLHKKYKGHKVKESVEQVDEATDKHHTYHVSNIDYETDGDHKAKKSLPKSMKVKVPHHVHKDGDDAVKDHINDHISDTTGYLHHGYDHKKIKKESVEQVDELDRSTLKSYQAKATKDNQDRAVRTAHSLGVNFNFPPDKKDMHKLRKRRVGIDKAKARTAEEVEQVDEKEGTYLTKKKEKTLKMDRKPSKYSAQGRRRDIDPKHGDLQRRYEEVEEEKKNKIKIKLDPKKKIGYEVKSVGPGGKTTVTKRRDMPGKDDIGESFEFQFADKETAQKFMREISQKRLGSSTGTADGKVRTEGPAGAGVGSPTRAHQQMAKIMKKHGGKLLRTDEGPRMKRVFKEDVELDEARQPKVGDAVHLGHGTRGGTGVVGRVIKIQGNMVHIKNDKGDTFKGPMNRVSVKESIELDELSAKTLTKYKNKARKAHSDAVQQGYDSKTGKLKPDFETKRLKRKAGFTKAMNKLIAQEDVEQVDEVSSDTLRSYVHKRSGQVRSDLSTGKHSPKTNKKAKGVVAALSRLDARKHELEPKLKREEVDEAMRPYGPAGLNPNFSGGLKAAQKTPEYQAYLAKVKADKKKRDAKIEKEREMGIRSKYEEVETEKETPMDRAKMLRRAMMRKMVKDIKDKRAEKAKAKETNETTAMGQAVSGRRAYRGTMSSNYAANRAHDKRRGLTAKQSYQDAKAQRDRTRTDSSSGLSVKMKRVQDKRIAAKGAELERLHKLGYKTAFEDTVAEATPLERRAEREKMQAVAAAQAAKQDRKRRKARAALRTYRSEKRRAMGLGEAKEMFTAVAIKNGKVVDQLRDLEKREFKDAAKYLKSTNKGAKVSFENKSGKVVHTEGYESKQALADVRKQTEKNQKARLKQEKAAKKFVKKHDCATHVEHAEFGQGQPIHGQHAEPDENGNIAWYDVMFEHGVEKNMPTDDLTILMSEMHENHDHEDDAIQETRMVQHGDGAYVKRTDGEKVKTVTFDKSKAKRFSKSVAKRIANQPRFRLDFQPDGSAKKTPIKGTKSGKVVREEDELNEMDPTEHVKKEGPNEFCVYNKDGKKVKTFDNKKDAEKYATETHDKLMEASPEGFEGTVKAMKKHKDIDNPYALAHYMKKKGYKSHKNPDGTDIQEKNVPTNPSLWSKMKSQAKSKFDVYPSAYANAWAAKKYKAAGGGWKKG